MSKLLIQRIEPFEYQITGEDVHVFVTSYGPYKHKPIAKLSGKGSRKIKADIPDLLKGFIQEESEAKLS